MQIVVTILRIFAGCIWTWFCDSMGNKWNDIFNL